MITAATPLLKPKQITLVDGDGDSRVYHIGRMDCMTGLEIVSRFITSGLPKLGEWDTTKDMIYKSMQYVAIELPDGKGVRLERLLTPTLVTNHIPSWEMLITVFKEVMEHNSYFFSSGKASSLLEVAVQKFLQSLTEIFTRLQQSSSNTDAPASTNSEQSTT